MKIGDRLHLTYCLNVHAGELWADQQRAILEKSAFVRNKVGRAGEKFALGLRLSARAAAELRTPEAAREARAWLEANGFYVFTINGFPYGQFHGQAVKQAVYAPDWQTRRRRDYTIALADILAELLPEGMSGSISTVPGSFSAWIKTPHEVQAMVERLCECVTHLYRLRESRGIEIHLGLEPEPACFLETTEETVRFFEQSIFIDGATTLARLLGGPAKRAEEILRRHLGVCFDTCHGAVAFEDAEATLRQYDRAGIRISKIQISAALSARGDETHDLPRFVEPVYLHQVRGRGPSGEVRRWIDLPDYLQEAPTDLDEVRVHFHVPLFAELPGSLSSTATLLTEPVFRAMSSATTHWEIETYTFDVLPEPLRTGGVERSIVEEYKWVLDRWRAAERGKAQ